MLVNALSNSALRMAALCVWSDARRLGQDRRIIALLCLLAKVNSVRSFLVHSVADGRSECHDSIPIWRVVAVYALSAVWLMGRVVPGCVMRIGLIGAVAVRSAI